jgi:hypothetical protein
MVNRQKNLLDAFSASAAVESAPEREPRAEPGGPFVSVTPREPVPQVKSPARQAVSEEEIQATLRQTSFLEMLLRPENRHGLVALQVVLLALVFLAGRASVGRVDAGATTAAEAGPPSDVTTAGTGSTGAGAPGSVRAAVPIPTAASGEDHAERLEPRTPAELALMDPANLYTIKLVEYQKDHGESLAWKTMDYLEDLRLPAVMLYRGERLFIVLGAAARQADLDQLLRLAKTMNGPGGKKAEFADAYVDKIAKFLDRDP